MRAEDSNNMDEKFVKDLLDIHWCSAVCDCMKNDWLFLGNFRSSHLDLLEK